MAQVKWNLDAESLGLNDYLAVDRTVLANERTHLSYMQTVISFLVAALTLFKILGGIEGIIVAVVLVVSAGYFYIRGQRTYRKVANKLAEFVELEKKITD
ncbi:MAG: DUF202 domain-containing protein [Culicoidibacterales bacterium]